MKDPRNLSGNGAVAERVRRAACWPSQEPSSAPGPPASRWPRRTWQQWPCFSASRLPAAEAGASCSSCCRVRRNGDQAWLASVGPWPAMPVGCYRR
jgi:hypothetical protein